MTIRTPLAYEPGVQVNEHLKKKGPGWVSKIEPCLNDFAVVQGVVETVQIPKNTRRNNVSWPGMPGVLIGKSSEEGSSQGAAFSNGRVPRPRLRLHPLVCERGPNQRPKAHEVRKNTNCAISLLRFAQQANKIEHQLPWPATAILNSIEQVREVSDAPRGQKVKAKDADVVAAFSFLGIR